MTSASVAASPSGRVLTDWWRQLATFAPRRLWIAELAVRRLEVLVRTTRSLEVDSLHRLLLEAITLSSTRDAADLAKRLGLNDSMLRLLLSELTAGGLVHADSRGRWIATDAGLQVAQSGEIQRPVFERRSFRLLADSHSFVPLSARGTSVKLESAARAPLDSLRDCVLKPLTWKQFHGFPVDVEEILDLHVDSTPSIPGWKRVPIQYGERHLLAVIESRDRILAFPVRLDGSMNSQTPCLSMEIPIAKEILELPDTRMDALRQSWRDLCSTVHDVNQGEIDACSLDRTDHVLRVKAPAALLERLKLACPEAFNSETWFLAGESNCRDACLLQLT